MEEQVQHSYELLIGISSSVIGILLIVVSFFLKRAINSIDGLKEALSDIKMIIESQKLELSSLKTSWETRHSYVENKVKNISEQVNKHHEDIIILKEKIK